MSINDDPSPFADWNHELSIIRFGSVEQVAQWLLQAVAGLDPTDPQEEETALRFVKALKELTTPEEFKFTMFDTKSNGMVVERDIPFATLCRHHVLPFQGVAHVGYVPDGKMAGLSKIPRLIAYYAAGLNTQEELTDAVADSLVEKLAPLGVAVTLTAQHSCMTIRGAKSGGSTITTAVRGVFADHTRTAKIEYLEAIR